MKNTAPPVSGLSDDAIHQASANNESGNIPEKIKARLIQNAAVLIALPTTLAVIEIAHVADFSTKISITAIVMPAIMLSLFIGRWRR